MFKISIPIPCHEDWGNMTPNEQGRHCSSCAKTVVDFTGMSDEQVKYFFLDKKEERVCGRFHNEQLHRITIELPADIFHISMPVWKKFLVAVLLAYSATLFSCDTKLNGSNEKNKGLIENTVGEMFIEPKYITDNTTVGDTAILLSMPTCSETVGITMVKDPEFIKGDIAIEPLPPPVPEVQTIGFSIPIIVKDDTPVVKNNYDKVGEVILIKPDTLKKKNLPSADSNKCGTDVYY